MKVIEEGKPKGWEVEWNCTGAGNGGGGCRTKLLVSESDLYLTRDSADIYYTFKCPKCGCETNIRDRRVPKRVQRILLNI